MSTTLDYALEYLRRGLSIIPIKPNEKKPYVKWTDYQNRRATEDEVQTWWRQWPDAGVAIVTGELSGVLVVDVDPRHGGTETGFPHTGRIVATGGGGKHLYYRYPGGGCKSYAGPHGVDVRCDGGYVIAPPTIHATGNVYDWLGDDDLGQLSIQLLWELCPHKVVAEIDATTDKWVTEALEHGFEEGSRNEQMTRVAGYFAGKGLAMDVTEHMLISQIAPKCDPPYPEDEIRKTVQSVYRLEKQKTKQQESEDGPVLKLVRYSDFMVEYGGRSVDWKIPSMLPENTLGFIYGAPGSFKTWIEFDMAISIAGGYPFLGIEEYTPSYTSPVLIFQQEDSMPSIAERLATIQAAREGLKAGERDPTTGIYTLANPKDLPIYLYPGREFSFTSKSCIQQLERFLQIHKRATVFFDPLYSLVPLDDYMVKAAQQLFVAKKLRDKYECSFLFIHHANKSSLGTSNRQNMWGSQFVNAFVESGYEMSNVPKFPRSATMRPHFKDAGLRAPIRIDFDIFDATAEEPGEWRYNTVTKKLGNDEYEATIAGKDTEDSKLDDEMRTLLKVLEGNLNGMSKKELLATCSLNSFDSLVHKGMIFRSGHKYFKNSLTIDGS